MSNSREEFKQTLTLTLESIFDELKQHSKELAQNCVLPTESLEIKIDPMFNDTCPSVQVTYNFLPSQDLAQKCIDSKRNYVIEETTSPLTRHLREELVRNHFDYIDDTTHKEFKDSTNTNTIHHMDRTKVIKDGKEILSCIWGYFEVDGEKSEWSNGWPNKLEVLGVDFDDAITMSIDEIIDFLKEKADENPT